MSRWPLTVVLWCEAALGQILETPPTDFGHHGHYGTYGGSVSSPSQEVAEGIPEAPGVPHAAQGRPQVSDAPLYESHGQVPEVFPSNAGLPHVHSHNVQDPRLAELAQDPGAVYYADATAGQPDPNDPGPGETDNYIPTNLDGSFDGMEHHYHRQYHDSGTFGSHYHECQGHEEELAGCEDLPECEHCVPVDCMFTQWSEWSTDGLKSLGRFGDEGCLGLKSRQRAISVASNQCGLPCFGDKTESKESYSEECDIPPQDCVLSFWGEWSTCQNERDQSIRTRHVETPSRGDGEACMGSLSETKPCGGPHPLPCTLSEWQHWTTCSASCGPGRHTRLRKVLSEGHLNGDTCGDSLLETDTCQVAECPTRDCKISAWSTWSYCSEGVQRMRHRNILQSPQGLGTICKASLVETAGCPISDSKHCEVSEWSAWTTCDRTCRGGQTYRQRELLDETHAHCTVKLKETAPCAEFPCFPHAHDCQLSAWSSWSTCSNVAGTGISSRKRYVETPAGPQGSGCVGVMKEILPCSLAPAKPIDCLWGEWSEWSGCSCSCGGGTKRRSRAIEMSPQNGGAPCESKDKEVIAECNTEKCTETCEDGYWSAWLEWGKCSATCSNGYRYRRRTLDVLPNACGALPSGDHEEFELCDSQPSCAEDTDCVVSSWGEWSHCSCSCNGIRERNRHIAAYARGQGQPCDNMPLKSMEHCNPVAGEKPPYGCDQDPRDCVLGEWERWSECSSSCGVGQQDRKREILQPAVAGGKACDGNLMVTQQCNLQPCKEEGAKDCVVGPWSMWGSCSHCGGQRWRRRAIVSLPNSKGTLCENYIMKEVSNCSSACHEARTCAWSEWSHIQCDNQCGDSSTLRTRTLQRLPKGVLPTDHLFVGDQHSHCFGSQINLTQCPSTPSCEASCKPVHCSFHAWSEWTEASCVGLCERQRVIAQMNNHCGAPCSGPLLQTKHCHTTCGHAVDCKLSEWSIWSNCTNLTSAALKGQRYRKRHIVSKPERGGFPCSGDLVQTRACETEMPEPCVFSMWATWSMCSARCGEGTRSRSRQVHQLAEDGGRQCHGSVEEIQSCHMWHEDCDSHVTRDCELDEWDAWSPCDFEDKRERRRGILVMAQAGGKSCQGSLLEIESCIEVVDCVVTEWTSWDVCSKTCGAGHTKRQRQISKFPSFQGKLCPEDLLQIKTCALDPCDAKDCQVSEWFAWSSCSATCGGGHQSRYRTVVSLRDPGGYGCYHSLAEDRACNQQSCEEACMWGEWEQWTDCSKTCGGGVTRRNRVLISLPAAGGNVCDDHPLSEVQPCNVDTCGALCVDGAWGPWDAWSQCSSSCGGGEMFRHRDMALMANDCGQPAGGESKETRFCNLHVPCESSKDCIFGPWSSWLVCSSSCDGVTTRRRDLSQFGSGSGSFCTGGLKEVAPCNPALDQGMEEKCEKGPPVDCQVTSWSEWSACSSTCGGGESKRSRALAREAFNGGFGCQQPLEEVVECARQRCHPIHLPVDCVLGDWHSWGACNACGGERSRRRQIVIYAQNGGRACRQADMAEIKACPHACDSHFTCSWASWEAWGQCSMSCGVGSQRKRIRHMVKLPSPSDYNQISQYGLSVGDYNALTNGYDHPIDPRLTVHHSDLLKKYDHLARKSQLLEDQHGHEVLVAFLAGSLSMLALLGLAARLSHGRVSESSQARTSFLSRNSREELSDAEAPFMSQ